MLRDHLLNPAESDSLKAASVAFGVFMGIVPVWGFQLAIAIALSFLFRLNKALVIIAANISIPPMIPVIIWLSHRTGAVWMGDKSTDLPFSTDLTFHQLKDGLFQYFAGGATLAVLAGMAFGVVTWLMLKIFRRRGTATVQNLNPPAA